MNERIAQFGERRRLTGTLSLPEGRAHDVGFVLLNAGVISRVGPQRLNVTLARALARAGYAALRFDLSGLGESRAAPDSAGFEQQAIADTREAISLMMRECGVSQCVLFGLCSGADNGFATALTDSRVCGLLLLDPYAYPTLISHLRAFRLRLRQPGAATALWRTFASVLRRLAARSVRANDHELATDDQRTAPTRQVFAQQLCTLLDRGVAIYLMYSGSLARHYNSPTQFEAVFGRRIASRLDAEFQPQSNHTRTELSVQQALVERVIDWARRKFAARGTGGAD